MPAMLPRRLLPWLFALALLLGQTTAFAHALTHLQADDPALPDKVCEVCVAQASLGSAAPATEFSLPVQPARPAGLPAEASASASVPVRHAQARAPPVAI
jgi:hypothetical protein